MLRKDRFDEREEDFYEALYTQSQAQFDSYVQTSTVLNNYAHVFSLLVRLRQVPHDYFQRRLSCQKSHSATLRHTLQALLLSFWN